MKLKVKALLQDDRPFRKRLFRALLLAFALTFTFIIIGIFDLYLVNIEIYPFPLSAIFWPVLCLGATCLLVLSIGLALLRGKVYDMAISISAGILLAGYLQGNFFDLHLGQLSGNTTTWQDYLKHSLPNALIWLVIITLACALYHFHKKAWKLATVVLPILLIGMQIAGLTSVAIAADVSVKAKEVAVQPQTTYLSTKGMFELSTKDNIIVIVLDRLDTKYIDTVKSENPNFFEPLDGFTYFSNHTSLYSRTYPSVTYLLTGKKSHFEEPPDTLFNEAYQNSTFLPELRKHGYTTKLYMDGYYTYSHARQLEGLADNLGTTTHTMQTQTMPILGKMVDFSAYRYSPRLLKPAFSLQERDFNKSIAIQGADPAYTPSNDTWILQHLRESGLTLQNRQNNFAYIHMVGCHEIVLNEQSECVGERNTNIVKHTQGEFNIVYTYLQEMKKLGVYDNATIIITGDHGKSEDRKDLQNGVTVGLFVKPKGSHGTPLQVSKSPVSHANFQATILDAAGISTEGYGQTVWEIPEDAQITRQYLYKVDKANGHFLEEYEINGDANLWSNWKFIKRTRIKYDR